MPLPLTSRPYIRIALLTLVPALSFGACSSDKKAVDTSASTTSTTIDDSSTPAATTNETSGAASISADCAKDKLALKTTGKLTIGTDKPAYSPWFSGDTPTNGKGFESAVAYAVADTLGFTKEDVTWSVVPFDKSYAPGTKDFDFDINQISITPDRAKVVDFSDGYYDVNQAVVAMKDSRAAKATTIADLKSLKFGVQVGTTSLDFVKNVVAPKAEPFVYNDTNGAKAALAANQIDAIVVDLPTGFYISTAEIEGSVVAGQFASQGGAEQFGMLFEKGSKLTGCVNEALAVLAESGKLAAIQEAELSTATNTPIFK